MAPWIASNDNYTAHELAEKASSICVRHKPCSANTQKGRTARMQQARISACLETGTSKASCCVIHAVRIAVHKVMSTACRRRALCTHEGHHGRLYQGAHLLRLAGQQHTSCASGCKARACVSESTAPRITRMPLLRSSGSSSDRLMAVSLTACETAAASRHAQYCVTLQLELL